jgi:outer membrane protein assembly factor BamB
MKRCFRFLASAALSISLCISAANAANDWPQWRGPNRDGHSADTGLLKQWPQGGPKLVWKATGLGLGFAGVSIVGDRVYAAGDIGDSSYLIALNRTDGKVLWKTKLGRAGAVGTAVRPDGPSCTPTVGDNQVIAAGQFGEVLCADAATGAAIWRKDYNRDFGGQMPTWGFCGMPLVDGDKVVLIPGGRQGALVAVNNKTGELIWRSKELADKISHSSPILVEIGGVRQIVLLTDASVAAVQASDGHLLWRAARPGKAAMIPTPIYQDGKVYVTAGYNTGCNLFKITADQGKFSAVQSYANSIMVNQHGGVVLVGKYLYGYSDSKGWTCQDFETGKAVWQSNNLGKGSLAYADGLLYLRAEAGKGTVAIIEATPDGYKELGRFDPPDRSKQNSWPHPVITGGRLYLRDQDVLQCYDVQGK